MADDDDPKEYRWETGYEKTWEEIREDKEGERLRIYFNNLTISIFFVFCLFRLNSRFDQ